VLGLGWDVFEVFWKSITAIEARKVLTDFSISMYPELKKGDRDKLHRNIYKQAYPAAFSTEKNKPLTTAQVAALIGR